MRTLIVLLFILTLPGWAQQVVGSDVEHVVAAGETLDGLAHQYGLAPEHLSFANGLPLQQALPEGARLVIPLRRILPASPPKNGLVLNIPERGIYFFLGGKFVKFYPLAVGRPDFPTPTGSFKIICKEVNPTWFPPAWAGLGKIAMPPGPKNPLGTRWIGLSGGNVGLHGTTSPSSIGMAASHGCLRMYPDQVVELFEKVWVGMPVRIEYETVRKAGDLAVAFPDVYGKKPVEEAARRLGLAEVPQTGRVGDPNGEQVEVFMGEQPLGLSTPPRIIGGRLWGSKDFLQKVSLQAHWSAEQGCVVVTDGQRKVAYAAGKEALRQGDQVLLPLTDVLSGFGIDYDFAPDSKTLHIMPAISSAQEALTE
jgi:L,D-transpeptidase ErfK/SrfK